MRCVLECVQTGAQCGQAKANSGFEAQSYVHIMLFFKQATLRGQVHGYTAKGGLQQELTHTWQTECMKLGACPLEHTLLVYHR